MAAVNVKLAARPALSFLMGEESFKEMTKEIAENYVNGERDGKYERYNEGGYPEEKGTFVKGRKQGKWIWYDKYGNEGIISMFKDGFMTSMEDKTASKQDSKDSRRR
jgi:hypothetical protein